MIIIKIILTAVICSIVAVTVRQVKPEFLPFIQIASLLILLTVSFGSIQVILEKLSVITDSADSFITESVFTLFKVLAIALATRLASEICKDNGNSSVALCTELTGKIMIIVMCFPLVEVIFELSLRFIE